MYNVFLVKCCTIVKQASNGHAGIVHSSVFEIQVVQVTILKVYMCNNDDVSVCIKVSPQCIHWFMYCYLYFLHSLKSMLTYLQACTLQNLH